MENRWNQLNYWLKHNYNLGISYAKKELFNQAEQEILTAISIIPNPEYRNVLQMVRQQIKDEV